MQNILTVVLKFDVIDILEFVLFLWLVVSVVLEIVRYARLCEKSEFERFIVAQSFGILALYLWVWLLR